MMRAALIGMVAAGLATPACAAELVQRGAAIAKANCSRCHAIGAHGASPNPKSPPFRSLARKYPLSNLEEALAEGIVVGHQGEEMPAFAFSPSEIRALLAYLNSVQQK
ncbi:MAG TPA: cytochrome c [Methylocystis sp.]|nr:cytochrome c [Methylocystis sp.]